MAVNQATTADVVNRSLRPLTDAEKTWATIRLRDAFTQILVTIPSAEARLDAGVISDPFNQLVVQTQAAMVLRVLANPDGVLEESTDDYTRRLDTAVSTGALYLTQAEIGVLSASNDGTSSGAFSMRAIRAVGNVIPNPFPASSTSVWL